MTIIGAFVVDMIGRRTLFIVAISSTWACLMIIGGLGLVAQPTDSVNKLTVFFALIWRGVSTLIGDLGWS